MGHWPILRKLFDEDEGEERGTGRKNASKRGGTRKDKGGRTRVKNGKRGG